MTPDVWQRRVDDVAELLVWSVLGQPPTLGAGRLLCIDGRAGSGKTTLGRAVRRAAGDADATVRVLHMDDMYEGWGGLDSVAARVAPTLIPALARGEEGRYQRYDWHRARLAEWRRVPPVDLLVIEGVGSGSSLWAEHTTLLAWLDAPRELRIQRGLTRDGEQVRSHWMAWMASEDAYFAEQCTRDRADVLIDSSDDSERPVVFC